MKGRLLIFVFLDFSKAFDMACFGKLIMNLYGIGIRGNTLAWINVFISDHSMRVWVAGVLSSSVPVTRGVPQGSVLGPLLFLIYINFFVKDLKCFYKIFADDLKVYLGFNEKYSVSNVAECQADINKPVAVSSSWGLSMNPFKCKVMRFFPRSCPLFHSGPSPYSNNDTSQNFVESHSDLGVNVERHLKFHCHVRSNVLAIGGLATNLLSCALNRSSVFMLTLFITHIRRKLEYGSCFRSVGYVGDVKFLERIQRRWTKAVAGMEELPYVERLNRLKLYSVKGRLLLADMILMWKIFKEKTAIKSDDLVALSPLNSTRGHRLKVFVPRSCLELRKRFFSSRVSGQQSFTRYCKL